MRTKANNSVFNEQDFNKGTFNPIKFYKVGNYVNNLRVTENKHRRVVARGFKNFKTVLKCRLIRTAATELRRVVTTEYFIINIILLDVSKRTLLTHFQRYAFDAVWNFSMAHMNKVNELQTKCLDVIKLDRLRNLCPVKKIKISLIQSS